jgi:hypothetical protein
LTGRREFIQAAPEESICETGYRRSGPTICYAAPEWDAPTIQHDDRARDHNTPIETRLPILSRAMVATMTRHPKEQPVYQIFKAARHND